MQTQCDVWRVRTILNNSTLCDCFVIASKQKLRALAFQSARLCNSFLALIESPMCWGFCWCGVVWAIHRIQSIHESHSLSCQYAICNRSWPLFDDVEITLNSQLIGSNEIYELFMIWPIWINYVYSYFYIGSYNMACRPIYPMETVIQASHTNSSQKCLVLLHLQIQCNQGVRI